MGGKDCGLALCNDCRREVARYVEGRRENIRHRVHRDQDSYPFHRKADRREERRKHDERTARNSRHAKTEEHRCSRDRRQLTGVKRYSVKPSHEQGALGLGD